MILMTDYVCNRQTMAELYQKRRTCRTYLMRAIHRHASDDSGALEPQKYLIQRWFPLRLEIRTPRLHILRCSSSIQRIQQKFLLGRLRKIFPAYPSKSLEHFLWVLGALMEVVPPGI